jgi:hypothetical protein
MQSVASGEVLFVACSATTMEDAPEWHGAIRSDLDAVESHDDIVWLEVPCGVCYRADGSHHDTLLIWLHLVRLPAPSHERGQCLMSPVAAMIQSQRWDPLSPQNSKTSQTMAFAQITPQVVRLHALPPDAQGRETRELAIALVVCQEVVDDRCGYHIPATRQISTLMTKGLQIDMQQTPPQCQCAAFACA